MRDSIKSLMTATEQLKKAPMMQIKDSALAALDCAVVTLIDQDKDYQVIRARLNVVEARVAEALENSNNG